MELCIKTRCSSRLDYLFNAVAEDKGLSELDFPYEFEGAEEEGGSKYETEEADDRPSTHEEEAVELEAEATFHSVDQPPLASADRISDKGPDTPRVPTVMSKGRDRLPSKIDGEIPVDSITNPASGLVAEFVANKIEDGRGPETLDANFGPPDIVTGKPNNEVAAEEGSVIDYSEDELFHEESSAGSSTLQGDIIDTRVSVVKASAPTRRTDISDIDNAEIQDPPTDYLVDLEEGQQPLEPQNGKAARSHIHGTLQNRGHVSIDVTKEVLQSRADAKELDVLLDDDTYDEAENRDGHEYTQLSTNQQSGTFQDGIQSELEHNSTDVDILNDTAVNGITSNREEEIVVINEKGRLGVEFSHTAGEDDDIFYDEEEEEEQTDAVQYPAPSPPSLKRGRSSLEGGLEANRSLLGIFESDSLMLTIADPGTDVKRVRSS